MSETRDLLIEIGTEELPPLALRRLSEAFRSGLDRLLSEQHLAHGESHAWASPRRLAVQVEGVPLAQPDREVVRRGPNMIAAFDEEGTAIPPSPYLEEALPHLEGIRHRVVPLAEQYVQHVNRTSATG